MTCVILGTLFLLSQEKARYPNDAEVTCKLSKVWSWSDGRKVRVVAFSPDGTRLAFGLCGGNRRRM